jgi:putative DNA primase/helicase
MEIAGPLEMGRIKSTKNDSIRRFKRHYILGVITKMAIISLNHRLKQTLTSSFQKKTSEIGAPSRERHKLTDYGNAQRFVDRHGDRVRYCHPWKHWIIWNGTHWEEDMTGEVMRSAKETARHIFHEAANEQDIDRRKALSKHAIKSEAAFSMKSLLLLAQSEPGIPIIPDQLDANHWLLNTVNGTVDLKTGQQHPHRKEDLLSKIVPVVYDSKAQCPLWESFLNRIMEGNQNLIKFLQKVVGYALTGSTREQCLFFLYGTGSNGKSVFLNTIKGMLGSYAMQIEAKSLMVKNSDSVNNDIARIKGARFVAANEGEDNQRLAEGFIKTLTGSDPVTARFLHAEYFTFVPTCKIFFSSNHKPRIKGIDEGIWRRIRMIPFHVTIPEEERDMQLPEKLREEWPGILRWAVEGCLLWQQEGLGIPEEVRMANDTYRSEMDVIASFIEDCCLVNPLAKVQATQLYKIYQVWCEENGEFPLSQRILGIRLRERGFKAKKSTGNRTFYFGLGVRDTSIERSSY